jgi:DNA-binding response OmpR family regulator
MDDRELAPRDHVATSQRPLLGMTILVVEDSRYASEAMRLLCLRSGARIRRADCLRSAHRHLQVYRPSAVIVDLGLPDGSGLDLIADLARSLPRVGVLLGTSGDTGMEEAAMEAGADGFLAKPIRNLAEFQAAILEHLPEDRRPMGPRVADTTEIKPDSLAYRDDLVHVAEALSHDVDSATITYATQFLHGIASAAEDHVLLQVVDELREDQAEGRVVRSGLARVAGLIHDRIEERISL